MFGNSIILESIFSQLLSYFPMFCVELRNSSDGVKLITSADFIGIFLFFTYSPQDKVRWVHSNSQSKWLIFFTNRLVIIRRRKSIVKQTVWHFSLSLSLLLVQLPQKHDLLVNFIFNFDLQSCQNDRCHCIIMELLTGR